MNIEQQIQNLYNIIRDNFKNKGNDKKYSVINVVGDCNIGKKTLIRKMFNSFNYNVIEINSYTIKNKEEIIETISNNTNTNAYLLYDLNKLTITSEKDIKTKILKINCKKLISPVIIINNVSDKNFTISISIDYDYFCKNVISICNKYNILYNAESFRELYNITNSDFSKLTLIIKKFAILDYELNIDNINNHIKIYIDDTNSIEHIINNILTGCIEDININDCTSLILYLYENSYKFINYKEQYKLEYINYYIEISNLILQCDIVNNIIYNKQLWVNINNILILLSKTLPHIINDIKKIFGCSFPMLEKPNIPKKSNLKQLFKNEYFPKCITEFDLHNNDDVFQILKYKSNDILNNIKLHI